VRVKICGVTRPEDAELCVRLGADFLGINFWSRSARWVSWSQAREITDAAAAIPVVGVFVNPSPEEVARALEESEVDLVQLHGDESPEEVAMWGTRAIKAFRLEPSFDPESLGSYASAWAFLFDTPGVSGYGGTGRSWSYGQGSRLVSQKPLFLAGGIGPENVADAVACRPFAVDVCSRIESAPGVKDPQRLEQFFQEVRFATKADCS
jgi:phosphoribosylanthranilate isomerase